MEFIFSLISKAVEAQAIHSWWTAHYDPFYLYMLEGAGIIASVSFISWFFPVLRSLAGAVLFGVVAALTGYRKGEQAIRAQDAAKAEEDAQKNTTPNWWGGK